jgi:hypothetical protein
LTYVIHFDNESGLFSVRSPAIPLVTGQGKSLYVAIDDLEAKLQAMDMSADRANVDLVFVEKKKDQIELTARVFITV